jgi:hypothetical protein
VIDRSNLPLIVQQIKIDSSGVIDNESKAELGKVKGVDYIIYGSVGTSSDTKAEYNDKGRRTGTRLYVTSLAQFRMTRLESAEVKLDKTYNKSENTLVDSILGGGEPVTIIRKVVEKTAGEFYKEIANTFPVELKIDAVNTSEGFFLAEGGKNHGVFQGVYAVYNIKSKTVTKSGKVFEDKQFIGFAMPDGIQDEVTKFVMVNRKERKTGLFGLEKKVDYIPDKAAIGTVKEGYIVRSVD